jgi:hypothetical protein
MFEDQLGGGGGGGGEGGGKSASSSASSASAINFGNGALFNGEGGLTPLAGLILAGLVLFAFLGLIIVAKK